MTTQKQLMRANASALGCESVSLVPFLWILLAGVLFWMTATAEPIESTMTLQDKAYARMRDKQEAKLQLATDLERRYRSGVYN